MSLPTEFSGDHGGLKMSLIGRYLSFVQILTCQRAEQSRYFKRFDELKSECAKRLKEEAPPIIENNKVGAEQ